MVDVAQEMQFRSNASVYFDRDKYNDNNMFDTKYYIEIKTI